MELYIIRHGQSENNVASEGDPHVPDCPLTDLGHRQAQRVAEYLTGEGITHLYCSPMVRALQTTQPIAEALGLAPAVWVDTHERGGAVWRQGEDHWVNLPGLARAEMEAQFPGYALPEEVTGAGWWRHYDGFEPREALYMRGQRVAAALARRAETRFADVVALVTHGGFADALIRGVLHLPTDESSFFLHNNTGITKINYPDPAKGWDKTVMFYHNRVDHLPPEMVS
ncbi:MAG: histidine phosphatase family protein [Anaerolineae bacterium]|nr:histidine phosphatase family protein [Anaerolineae bacterium]